MKSHLRFSSSHDFPSLSPSPSSRRHKASSPLFPFKSPFSPSSARFFWPQFIQEEKKRKREKKKRRENVFATRHIFVVFLFVSNIVFQLCHWFLSLFFKLNRDFLSLFFPCGVDEPIHSLLRRAVGAVHAHLRHTQHRLLQVPGFCTFLSLQFPSFFFFFFFFFFPFSSFFFLFFFVFFPRDQAI